MARTRFLFSSDFHGSGTAWRKFLNASKMFDLDALVISGDLTPKVMVPIIKQPDNTYKATFMNKEHHLSESELPEFQKQVRAVAYLYHVCTQEEAEWLWAEQQRVEDLFAQKEVEMIRHWLSLVPARVPERCRFIICPGNDDKFVIDDTIRNCGIPNVIFGELEVVALDREHEVLTCGWSNPTPFNSPREAPEEKLYDMLDGVASRVKNLDTAVFCIHVPPYDSFIDHAPELDRNKNVVIRGGNVNMVPVGSKAVRRVIEKYQPLLTLHGHIHESPGFVKIGRTQCINPGSEYGEGILRAFLVEIDGQKITRLQRVEG